MRRILTLLLTATSVAFGLQAATAADMGLPAKAPPAPPPSWTGFYIGLEGGGGWGTSESQADVGTFVDQLITLNGGTVTSPLALSIPGPQVNYNGFLGGVDVGYNWQFGGMWLVGIEGDFDGSTMQGNTACVLVFNCSVKHDWVADITGRFGLIAQNNVLLYVKGGWAGADSQYNNSNSVTIGTTTFAANASASGTLGGGLLGVGIEYMITPNLMARLEYDHIEFETQTFGFGISTTPPVTGTVIPTLNVAIHDSMNIVKGGIDYKFWSWGGGY